MTSGQGLLSAFLEHANLPGAIAATLLTLGLAVLWYSPLMFGRTWREYTAVDRQGQDMSSKVKRAILIIPASFMSALMFAALIGPAKIGFASMAGFGAGLFWIASAIGISYALEPRPFSLWAINGTYHILQFTLYGVCIGAANTYM